ncbi:hypothetical protein T484DRAFT_1772640, partial [Baffinella frigidus]
GGDPGGWVEGLHGTDGAADGKMMVKGQSTGHDADDFARPHSGAPTHSRPSTSGAGKPRLRPL